MDWQGKKVLVIGAGGGIGQAIAEHLKSLGGEVWGTYRKNPGEDSVYSQQFPFDLEWEPGKLEEETQSILSQVNPDYVFFAAGSAHFGSFREMDTRDVLHIYHVDLIAPAIVTKTVLNHLIDEKREGGLHIVSAIAGVMPAIKNMAAYSSAKFGLVGLARSLAMETIGTKVRVTVSCPAGTKTDLPRNASGDRENFLKIIGNLEKNFESPREVAEGIVGALDSREVVVFPTEKAKALYKK